MCSEPTPVEKQVLCSRCGKVCNLSDSWEHDWPMHGDITLGMSSVIHWTLMEHIEPTDVHEYGDRTKAVINGTHPAVEKFGYQEVKIRWGHNQPYRLCWDCQHRLIELIGLFFFDKLPLQQPIYRTVATEKVSGEG